MGFLLNFFMITEQMLRDSGFVSLSHQRGKPGDKRGDEDDEQGHAVVDGDELEDISDDLLERGVGNCLLYTSDAADE